MDENRNQSFGASSVRARPLAHLVASIAFVGTMIWLLKFYFSGAIPIEIIVVAVAWSTAVGVMRAVIAIHKRANRKRNSLD